MMDRSDRSERSYRSGAFQLREVYYRGYVANDMSATVNVNGRITRRERPSCPCSIMVPVRRGDLRDAEDLSRRPFLYERHMRRRAQLRQDDVLDCHSPMPSWPPRFADDGRC